MSESQQEIVVIDTKSAGDSRAYKCGFHQSQRKRLYEMLKKALGSLERSSDDGVRHSHQTIGVFGERGAGKTSFILQAITPETPETQEGQETLDKCAIIGPIDPTILEHGEQLLPHIIVSILENNESVKTSIRDFPEGELAKAYLECVKQLRVLSDQWTETVGKDLMSDPETFGYELLEEMHSARHLRKSFREFCRQALEKEGKAMFLVLIDDVDMAFDQGWPVLETVRKYLDFPQMLPIILGDFSLYMLLVKQQHQKKLGAIRQVEESSVDDGVAKLADQYLLKVLPPHHRIELVCKSPYDPNAPIYYLDKEDDDREFKEFFQKALQDLLSANGESLESPFKYLPPANVRRLSTFARTLEECRETLHKQMSHDARYDSLARICHVFDESLNRYGLEVVDILKISEDPVRELSRLLPQLFQSENFDFWKFSSCRADDHWGEVKLLIRLAVDVAFANEENAARKVGMLLALLVRMGWLGQDYVELRSEFSKITEFQDEGLFIGYLGLNNDPSTTQLALKMLAIESARAPAGQHGLKQKSKSHIYYQTESYKLDDELGKPSVALLYANVRKKTNGYRILSPILALARISDALLLDENERLDTVMERTVSIPIFGPLEDPKHNEEKQQTPDETYKAYKGLTEKLDEVEWKAEAPKQGDWYGDIVHASSHLMRRFSSWIDSTGIGTKSKNPADAWSVVDAFFERLTDESDKNGEHNVLYAIGKNISKEILDDEELKNIKHKPSQNSQNKSPGKQD